jgi:hypothetical protein
MADLSSGSVAAEAVRPHNARLRFGPHRSRDGGFLGHELSEGLPVPREPAYAAKRSHDQSAFGGSVPGEAPAASE